MGKLLRDFDYTITVSMSEEKIKKLYELLTAAEIPVLPLKHRDTVELFHRNEDAADLTTLAELTDRRF